MTAGLCLDTGALVAVERGSARVRALLRRALDHDLRIEVTAGVLAQAWRGGAGRQARLARFLQVPELRVAPLDGATARTVGELCGLAGTSDVVDAHVALHARANDLTVVTSDPDDIRTLGRGLPVVAV